MPLVAAHQECVDRLLHHPPAERGTHILGVDVDVGIDIADAVEQLVAGNVRKLAEGVFDERQIEEHRPAVADHAGIHVAGRVQIERGLHESAVASVGLGAAGDIKRQAISDAVGNRSGAAKPENV